MRHSQNMIGALRELGATEPLCDEAADMLGLFADFIFEVAEMTDQVPGLEDLNRKAWRLFHNG